jgi:hypothetical protein
VGHDLPIAAGSIASECVSLDAKANTNRGVGEVDWLFAFSSAAFNVMRL